MNPPIQTSDNGSRVRLRTLCIAAAAVSAIWIGANSSKPFHIDDPLYIYWARTIAPLSGETPVENVNWESFDEPLFDQVCTKGPGWALLLSGIRHVWGDRETLSHWLQWPFATAFLVGSALVGARFGAPVWPVFLLCASSPLFLIPVASAMADIACAGLAVLGLGIWLRSTATRGKIAGAVLLALAGQMKPAVIPLLPLLFFTANGGMLRNRVHMGVAAGGCFLAGLYPSIPPMDIGGSVVHHFLFILNWSWQRGGLWIPKSAYGLATLSALAFFPAAFLVVALIRNPNSSPYARARAFGLAGIIFISLSALGFWRDYGFSGGTIPGIATGLNTAWFHLSTCGFIAWCVLVLADRSRRPRGWLLAWLALVFAGSVAGTPFPAARFLILCVPALAIILAADMRRHLSSRANTTALLLAIAGNLWLSSSLALNDHSFARFSQVSARRGASVALDEGLPLRTTGQWGLRFYVEKNGGTVVGRRSDQLSAGAVLLHPELTDHRPLAPHLARRAVSRQVWEDAPLLRILAPWRTIPPWRTSAAFHGGYAWLPYAAVTDDPIERIEMIVISPLTPSR